MKVRYACPFFWPILVILALHAPVLAAHDEDWQSAARPSARILGEIDFPVATEVPAARQAFIQGMLLLHLFEYPYAREQFLLAQELDPGLVMAFWGEAMTFNHPIWDQQDLAAARSALLKLGATPEQRVARGQNPTEQGFLAALERLYGPGSKSWRDQAYMQAMEQLAAAFPANHEVQLFYALALFGVQAGVRDTATYMLCTAIAQGVFSENPRHPGAAHYLIHGVDDPVHAVLGLRAARALAAMAPDAGHAQHMTSHIFLAVGMWSDVVAANEAAVRVQNAMRLEHGQPARHWGHYNYWLLYGYLQQGREAEARTLLQAAYSEAQADDQPPGDRLDLDPDGWITGSVVQMWARYLIETRRFDGPIAEWTFRTGEVFDPRLTIVFLRARLTDELSRQEETAPGDLLYLERLRVMQQELSALAAMAHGDLAGAVAQAEEASRIEGSMPFSFGPPFVDLPAAELLGELLLASGQEADAAAAYELQLQRTRLKARALEGLVAALEAEGRSAEAAYQLSRLQQIRQGGSAAVVTAESEP